MTTKFVYVVVVLFIAAMVAATVAWTVSFADQSLIGPSPHSRGVFNGSYHY